MNIADKTAIEKVGMMTRTLINRSFCSLLIAIVAAVLLSASLPGLANAAIFDTSEFDGTAGAYWTASSNSARTWAFATTTTPSTGVGPSGPHSGSQYIFTEASSSVAGDAWYLTSSTIDATTYAPYVDFWYNKYHNGITSCWLYADISTDNGASWDPTPIWSTNVDDGAGHASGVTWHNQSLDLSAYTNDIKVRFRATSGGAFQCDTAIDLTETGGTTRCTPTTGPVVVPAGGAVAGDPVNVCGLFNLNGATLTNVTIKNGTTTYYNETSCTDIPTTTGSGAPVSWVNSAALDITVTATNDCGDPISGSGTFAYDTCIATPDTISVNGGILSGTTTDVTNVITVTDVGATLTNVKVYEVTGSGNIVSDLERFNSGGPTAWGAGWKATIADGSTLQSSSPANGDLMTGLYTRSVGTGPSTADDGAFLYYEASVGAATDRYLVNSTLYDAAQNQLVVTFRYNMNGANIGTLQLQAKNPSYNGNAWTTEWSKSGNQSDIWRSASVDLHGGAGVSATAYTTGNTQLRFRFTYGSGILGDIALDSVHILGPRAVNPTPLFDGTAVQAQTVNTAGWPEGDIRIDATGTDNCGGPQNAIGYGRFISDLVKPEVTSFAMPTSSLSPVSIYSFTASDLPAAPAENSGVAGYKITESAAAPLAGDTGWTAAAPVKISSTPGAKTFYAWAKDGAGNISLVFAPQAVTINPDVTPPTVSAFVLPSSSFAPITISSLAVSDDSGNVVGYMITEEGDAVPSGAGDPRWVASAPGEIVTAATGSTNFYAWAIDASGNISASLMATVDVKVDTYKPVVTFLLPATHTALNVPVSTFIAVDDTGGTASNTGVAGYMITTNSTPPLASAPGWTGTPLLQVVVPDQNPHTFWGWAKDGVGNVSTAVSSTVTVTLPATCNFDIDPNGTLIQTENYTSMGAPNPWAWDTILTPLADASGDLSSGGYLITAAGGTGSTPNGSRADYPIFFPNGTEGNWCVWIRALDQSGNGGGDSNFWGVDGSYVGAMTQPADNQWAWTNSTQNGSKCTSITVNGQDEYPAGTFGQWHTINLWPREQGQKNDMFYLIRNTSTNALNAFTGTNDQTTVMPQTAYTELDPTCVDSTGGGAPGSGTSTGPGGFITIADGQSLSGSDLDVEPLYTSDLTNPLEYRSVGGQSDGFEHSTVDNKWNHTNIGNDALLADTVPMVEGQGYFKLAGSGADIWGTGDFFAYHYQAGINGNFTIDVQMKKLVDKQTNTTTNQNASAKAGIMVRQSLANNSRHVMMLVTSTNGSRLQSRATDGGTTSYVNGTNNGVTASDTTWLRLRRTNNLFEGFHSTNNGASWTSVGTTTVNMTGSVNIGLGVTSHNTSRDSIGSFDNFLVMPADESSMSENWTSTTTAVDTTQTSAWTAGDYGVAVRGPAGAPTAYQVNTFSYDPCIDASPSTLAVNPGQTVGGGAVSLASLFSHTGNLGTFRYQINGTDISNPWNSYALVPYDVNRTIPVIVTLSVRGTDPDCGGSELATTGTIAILNSCEDPSPSTLTILTGQTIGGPSVDLTAHYSATGNVVSGGLTFKINGEVIGDPSAWDSRSYGTVDAQEVIFEISGIDPDCGGNHITASNTLEIDNTCVKNTPSITFDQHEQYVGAGRAIPITVTIRNEDSFNCAPATFTVAISSETENEAGDDFAASFFTGTTTAVLQGREYGTFELAVTANAGATEWHSVDSSVQVTSDGGHTPASDTVQTTVFLVSPITHNAITTRSSKWGGSKGPEGETATFGKWGTSENGAMYGNFDCDTCHVKNAGNVKWIKDSIALADSTQWGGNDTTPVTRPIVFKDARDGSSDWGHDLGGHTSSDNTCEVCHSTTLYHRYDTVLNPPDPPEGTVGPQANLDHFNDRDCTDCHRHSLGFTASCTGCHGNPPIDSSLGGPNGLADIPAATGSTSPGTHYKHVMVLGYPCTYCHANYRDPGEMPREVNGRQDINHTFDVFGSAEPAALAGHYTGQDGVSYEEVVTPLGQGTMTCENIYCHGGTDNMGGSNPQWNGNITCNSCHGTSPTNTPPGYSHTTHVGKMKQACNYCHGNDPVPGSNGHVNGSVHVNLDGLADTIFPSPNASYRGSKSWDSGVLAPSATYGSCASVTCHFGTTTPSWNQGPATCTTCHNNGTDDGLLEHAAPNTGNHNLHVDPQTTIGVKMIGAFVNECESCHGGGANTGHHDGHINGQLTIGGGMTYDKTNATCTSLCHGLEGVAGMITWGSGDNLTCQACHASPFIGPTVIDPDNEGIGMATSGFGSHLQQSKGEVLDGSTDWNAQCQVCHPYHESGAGVVDVPLPPLDWQPAANTSSALNGNNMQEKLGLQYTITGAVHLKAYGGAGSEAETCWNCHGTDDTINEWGYNADTNGAFPYTKLTDIDTGTAQSHNYGKVYTDAGWTTLAKGWVDASGKGYYRKDGYQHSTETIPSYVSSRRISSVHSANFDLTQDQASSVFKNIDGSGNVIRTNSQVLETPAQIRCSYCHDVHDLNRAVDLAGTNEVATGRPYLRGSWFGNPYAADMPPLDSYTYPSTGGANSYGQRFREGTTSTAFPAANAVPRLFANKDIQAKGGYFLDQNSNWPTTGKAEDLSDTGGICVLCHGNNVNGMNYYAATMWRTDQVNGHANAALGGSGSAHASARNIFDGRRGATTTTGMFMAGQDGVNTYRWGDVTSVKGGGPYRNVFNQAPKSTAANSPPRNTGWYGGTEGSTTVGAQYGAWHNGTTTATTTAAIGNNGTTARAHDFTCSKCHSPHATGLPALLITNCLDFRASNWSRTADNSVVTGPTTSNTFALRSQNNCHRKEGTTSGWHRLNTKQ